MRRGTYRQGSFLFTESGQTGESGAAERETVLGVPDNRRATRPPRGRRLQVVWPVE